MQIPKQIIRLILFLPFNGVINDRISIEQSTSHSTTKTSYIPGKINATLPVYSRSIDSSSLSLSTLTDNPVFGFSCCSSPLREKQASKLSNVTFCELINIVSFSQQKVDYCSVYLASLAPKPEKLLFLIRGKSTKDVLLIMTGGFPSH